ncbi:MAG: hypothetical protein HJJLKODD_00040 [Phycisphaerae bacterium]|nr:hypothetical protein [Phycisphaerae bacterium]
MVSMATMTAPELLDRVETALALVGLPEYPSVEQPGHEEVLRYLPAGELSAVDTWALVLVGSECDDYLPVDTELAHRLLLSYLREWLLQRGWQVQVRCGRTWQRWTLVDCLSPAEGGGDRLDVDYPYGDSELTVLVQALIAIHAHH